MLFWRFTFREHGEKIDRSISMMICLVVRFGATAKEIIIVLPAKFERCFGIKQKRQQI